MNVDAAIMQHYLGVNVYAIRDTLVMAMNALNKLILKPKYQIPQITMQLIMIRNLKLHMFMHLMVH